MRKGLRLICMVLAIGIAAAPAGAQVRTVDPNRAINADQSRTPRVSPPQQAPQDARVADPRGDPVPSEAADPTKAANGAPDPNAAETTTVTANTYRRTDLFSAGERVFGKGAEGLGGILEKILKEQGEPNAYIAGREASGAVVVGLRYGSGILSHRIEGDQPIYWTGPSVGFDLGGNASKIFVLVYNLYDTEDIYRRFPEGEGHLYFVGGFSATYLRRGNIVLIPIRLGVGVRAGVNVGYMKFRKKQRWLPF
ncbi:MAG: hypothetical protein B7Y98_05175 [Sphingomonas sp. 32-62-10]|nr:MAG: hypothetical protein B7Y98_05175 [Sphingomonas sp. 32-62-10]